LCDHYNMTMKSERRDLTARDDHLYDHQGPPIVDHQLSVKFANFLSMQKRSMTEIVYHRLVESTCGQSKEPPSPSLFYLDCINYCTSF
jgi:hypothetical protein